jgi:hypothetical protein
LNCEWFNVLNKFDLLSICLIASINSLRYIGHQSVCFLKKIFQPCFKIPPILPLKDKRSFPRTIPPVLLVDQKLPTFPKNMYSLSVSVGFVLFNLWFSVRCSIDPCLPYWPFAHCMILSSNLRLLIKPLILSRLKSF